MSSNTEESADKVETAKANASVNSAASAQFEELEPANSPKTIHPTSTTKWKYRFEVSVMALSSLVVAVCVLQRMASSTSSVVRLASLGYGIFLVLFGYEWVFYFSEGLTRRKRAFFDVKNFLQTYQPRRDTDEGRKFKPDPPTPNVSMVGPKRTADDAATATASSADEKQGAANVAEQKMNFNNWRRKHYENEYQMALQMRENEATLNPAGEDVLAAVPGQTPKPVGIMAATVVEGKKSDNRGTEQDQGPKTDNTQPTEVMTAGTSQKTSEATNDGSQGKQTDATDVDPGAPNGGQPN